MSIHFHRPVNNAHLAKTLALIEQHCGHHGLVDHDGQRFLFSGPVHTVHKANYMHICRAANGLPHISQAKGPSSYANPVSVDVHTEGNVAALNTGRVYQRQGGTWVRKS